MERPHKKRRLTDTDTEEESVSWSSAESQGCSSTASSSDEVSVSSTSREAPSPVSASEEERIFKLYEYELLKYSGPDPCTSKKRCKDRKSAPMIADDCRGQDHMDQIRFWGPRHRLVLRGREWPGQPDSFFFLERVVLERNAEGRAVLLGTAVKDFQPCFVQFEASKQDRGCAAIDILLRAVDRCGHEEHMTCRDKCLKPLVAKLDALYAMPKWWLSADTRRSAFIAMLHIVRGAAPDATILEVLARDPSYGMHAASPLVRSMAIDAGLFEHSLQCSSKETFAPPEVPPLPEATSRKTVLAGPGKRIAPGHFVHDSLLVERGYSRKSEQQRIHIGDFVAVDSPDGEEWIARIASLHRRLTDEQDEGVAHLQWLTRHDSTLLYSGNDTFLQNELFARPQCSDEPISCIRGRIDVEVLEGDEAINRDVLSRGKWILRFVYDETTNGRFSPYRELRMRKECWCCAERQQSLEENGEDRDAPRAIAGQGSILFKFQGIEYHARDALAYGRLDATEIVQLLAFDQDEQHIRARLFIRADLRNSISNSRCFATSGAQLSHIKRERLLYCVPGVFRLPLCRIEDGIAYSLLGKSKLLLASDLGLLKGSLDASALSNPLDEPYDFVVAGYCGALSRQIRKRLARQERLDAEQCQELEHALQNENIADSAALDEPCQECFQQRQSAGQAQANFREAVRSANGRKLQILDIFGGFGGTALGLVSALGALPFDAAEQITWRRPDKRTRSNLVSLVSVDNDVEAADTYAINLPFARAHESDVDQLIRELIADFDDARKDLLTPRGLDILILTPPCQAISRANHRRSLADHRAALIATGLSFVELLKPRIVLIEEVPGLLERDFQPLFRFILRVLIALGYACDTGVRCTSEFGLAQGRQRCLIMATRIDCAEQCLLPASTHAAADLERPMTSAVPVLGSRDLADSEGSRVVRLCTVGELSALRSPRNMESTDDLAPFDWFLAGELRMPNGQAVEPAVPTSKSADFDDVGEFAVHGSREDAKYGSSRVMGWSTVDYRRQPANAWQRYYRRHHLTGALMQTVEDQLTGAADRTTIRTAYTMEIDRQGPDRPHLLERQTLNTLTTTTRKRDELIGGNQRRTELSIRELLRFQGFCDSIIFPEGTTVQARRKMIGNAVSPFLSFNIGRSMLKTLVADWQRDIASGELQ